MASVTTFMDTIMLVGLKTIASIVHACHFLHAVRVTLRGPVSYKPCLHESSNPDSPPV